MERSNSVRLFTMSCQTLISQGGRLPPTGEARRPPTIYDVARRAGVSKSLVSLVLRGSPQVSDNRRAAVLAAIDELGYRPSQAAMTLASHRTRSLEVVIDDYRNLSFVGLLTGLRDALAGQGYHLSVSEVPPIGAGGAAGIVQPATPADGRVIAAEPVATLIAGWSGPVVVAGWRESVPPDVDLVAGDDEHGGRIACRHLLGLGHRSVGHLTGSGGPAHHRRIGYTQAIREAGREPRIYGLGRGTTEADGYRAAIELLDRHPDTTGIVAANDVMALGAMAAVAEQGLAVPADISLVGYDNSPLAQSRYLSLTSVDDRSPAVGAAAGRALVARITNPQTPLLRALIEPILIVRGTTRRA
jgi:DNA-binding LacI/PurR family transcriptional regulator